MNNRQARQGGRRAQHVPAGATALPPLSSQCTTHSHAPTAANQPRLQLLNLLTLRTLQHSWWPSS